MPSWPFYVPRRHRKPYITLRRAFPCFGAFGNRLSLIAAPLPALSVQLLWTSSQTISPPSITISPPSMTDRLSLPPSPSLCGVRGRGHFSMIPVPAMGFLGPRQGSDRHHCGATNTQNDEGITQASPYLSRLVSFSFPSCLLCGPNGRAKIGSFWQDLVYLQAHPGQPTTWINLDYRDLYDLGRAGSYPTLAVISSPPLSQTLFL